MADIEHVGKACATGSRSACNACIVVAASEVLEISFAIDPKAFSVAIDSLFQVRRDSFSPGALGRRKPKPAKQTWLNSHGFASMPAITRSTPKAGSSANPA